MFILSHLTGFGAFTRESAASYIESLQVVSITIGTSAASGTASISSVTTGRTVLFFLGFSTTHTSGNASEIFPRVELTDATTVTAYRNTSSATQTVTVRVAVVQFSASMVSSVQRGTVTLGSAQTSNTATITSVTTGQSAIFYQGFTCDSTGDTPSQVYPAVDLTNATTVTATRNSSGNNLTVAWQVVEFQAAVIASIQKRSVTVTNTTQGTTDTISSVNTACTILLHNGSFANSSSYLNANHRLELTNSTTVTISRQGVTNVSRTIKYTVVEFAAGVIASLQRGSVTLSGVTSADSTITSVDLPKAVPVFGGFTSDGSSHDQRACTVHLEDATTVRTQRNSGTNNAAATWEVAVFI